MARIFGLNTAQIAGLKQVIMAMPDGVVYDHIAQASAGEVTLAAEREASAAQLRKLEKGGFKVLTEK